jgi:hypothetical protein
MHAARFALLARAFEAFGGVRAVVQGRTCFRRPRLRERFFSTCGGWPETSLSLTGGSVDWPFCAFGLAPKDKTRRRVHLVTHPSKSSLKSIHLRLNEAQPFPNQKRHDKDRGPNSNSVK